MAEALSPPDPEEQEELLAEEGSGLTTQWSLEDDEEAARERRRRERDRRLQDQDEDHGGLSSEPPEQEKLLKASEAPEQEEDEGFADWCQKPEPRPQHCRAEEPPEAESTEGDQEADRPLENQDDDQASPATVCLEGLHLHPSSESQEEPGPEATIQDSLAPVEAEDADEQECQQPRTPSPLVLEETTEHSSPPLSPSTKLIDRTESLNRSIKKSNSVKKSQPALPISKIDERLEQYTQAVETAGRTSKLVRQPSIELPSMAVASTKSRWETGEVQAHSAAKGPSCKDIVAGDMSKKTLWEQKGGSKTSSTVKSTPSGKRYKFVATGHGKYEKVLMDEGSEP
ncbi:PREDICTED: lymphocyte-specific protein 1 isoform X2 [Hipposideros armiger]|uniref:Lymphocyte-specific protein 1 isoform X2 n=1 Tax=Hipposideros armiger TaxID=186990 RepID=A0A8B7TB49_HIPAR|nr:PREDICTED: lymphocyte-specific protein 1 isoform X2 [Hipposideros armiger]